MLLLLILINLLISISLPYSETSPDKLLVSQEDGPIYFLPIDDKPYRGIEFVFPIQEGKESTPEYALDSGKSDFRCELRPNHFGCDLFAETGTEIVAPADGRVTMSVFTPYRGPGNKIAIYHGNGVYTYYLHMDKNLVIAGEQVKKGEVIATVGNTGNAEKTPPHLHFEIDLSVEKQRKPSWFVEYIDYMPFPGVVHLHSSDPLAYIVSKKSDWKE